ncbi:MAG: Gfo/Idh/MocA family oxidoreductase, partial [Planctomycetaceae bacterium]
NAPIELACDAVCAKGRIGLVGVVGVEIPRRPMYLKEAVFVVSCSYGPGRYDANYEERGIDYPVGQVRWTEQRNIQAVLDLIGEGKLKVDHLISHRFQIKQAADAYALISQSSEPYLGIILNYPPDDKPQALSGRLITHRVSTTAKGKIGLSVLGAGNFARMTMLPRVAASGLFELRSLASASGLSAHSAAEKHGFAYSTADESVCLEDAATTAVMILTRHDLHAAQIVRALEAGKHVFVEKPIAINESQLDAVEQAILAHPDLLVMVGFNRRFSAAAIMAKQHFERVAAPLTIQYRFNAGAIPADVWVQHPEEGGGRIIGEACHAIDLVTFLTGSLPIEVYATCIGGSLAPNVVDDQAFITLRHANGSISSIGYLAGGDRAFSKERIEVLGGGRMAVIDDFRRVELGAGGRIQNIKTPQGKGHAEEIEVFKNSLQHGQWPIPWHELHRTAQASFAAVMSLREGMPLSLVAITS